MNHMENSNKNITGSFIFLALVYGTNLMTNSRSF
uniref:Uncharacterized protein n=1 Tax=Rhizophora mucronata TaxID=61149 RepID=A0A2P2NQC8_RHIMU